MDKHRRNKPKQPAINNFRNGQKKKLRGKMPDKEQTDQVIRQAIRLGEMSRKIRVGRRIKERNANRDIVPSKLLMISDKITLFYVVPIILVDLNTNRKCSQCINI